MGLELGANLRIWRFILLRYKVVTHAFTAADLRGFEKLWGYSGEDNSDKNMGYSKINLH